MARPAASIVGDVGDRDVQLRAEADADFRLGVRPDTGSGLSLTAKAGPTDVRGQG